MSSIVARELVRRGYVVTAVKATPTMLARFRRNLPGVEVLAADMRTLALDEASPADLLGTASSISPREDQRDMFARFPAHAAPGAALMFTSGDVEGEAIGELEGDPLYHGSLHEAKYGALLETNGFDVVAHVAQDPSFGYRTVWLARQR